MYCAYYIIVTSRNGKVKLLMVIDDEPGGFPKVFLFPSRTVRPLLNPIATTDLGIYLLGTPVYKYIPRK